MTDPAALARGGCCRSSEALRGWPTVLLSPGEARDLGHGRRLPRHARRTGLCRALDPDGRLLAVCEGRAGLLRPMRVLRAIR